MIRKYFTGIVICFIASPPVNAQTIDSFDPFLKNSNQALFVKTSPYTSTQGKMFLYERKTKHRSWKLIDSFAVTVGRNGLAKDAQTQITFNDSVPVKHEGDGKSPAGIFSLGPVFSYHNIKKLHMPFVQVDTNFFCVDDANSSYYNTLIVSDTAKHDYNSFEYMRRRDSLYEYGVWVLYNSDPVVHGNGSCIFLHVWLNENSPTAGCTAMSRKNILKLIYWLNKRKKPMLVQVAEN
jgi:L,D-peptidoglycan transpeptidase YkuD (ErfK/YbiS/YcfS/YnhG family)